MDLWCSVIRIRFRSFVFLSSFAKAGQEEKLVPGIVALRFAPNEELRPSERLNCAHAPHLQVLTRVQSLCVRLARLVGSLQVS